MIIIQNMTYANDIHSITQHFFSQVKIRILNYDMYNFSDKMYNVNNASST